MAEPAGSLKNAAGKRKAQVQLFPPSAIIHGADALAEGAAKYGAYNWREPGSEVELMQYIGAIKRHVDAILDGEDIDPESKNGKTHWAGIIATAAVVIDATEVGTLVDDRPPTGTAAQMLRDRAGVHLREEVEVDVTAFGDEDPSYVVTDTADSMAAVRADHIRRGLSADQPCSEDCPVRDPALARSLARVEVIAPFQGEFGPIEVERNPAPEDKLPLLEDVEAYTELDAIERRMESR